MVNPTPNKPDVTHAGLDDLVSEVRNRLVGTRDSVCTERARLVTEAFQACEGEPRVLVRAKAFRHVLANMTLDLSSNPVFAGNTSSAPRAWMLIPEHGCGPAAQVVHEHPELKGILDGAVPGDIASFWAERAWGGNSDPGHLAVDLDTVVHGGLTSILTRLSQHRHRGSQAEQQYREGMRICLEAVIDWARRYARAADEAARSCSDPLRRACLERMAAACVHVPAYPARDLFEGLQAIVLVHMALAIEGNGMSVSIGSPDRILAPFLSPDCDRDETVALLAAFMLKVTANSVFGRGSKTQAITIGGADHRGVDQCNLLTEWFLDAADWIRVGDPHLFLRWHDRLPEAVKDRAAALLADGLSMPLLISDSVTAEGLVKSGMSREDAWRFCVIGCNELGVPGLSAESANARAGTIQFLEVLNRVLLDHADPAALTSTADILGRMEKDLHETLLQQRLSYDERLAAMAERAPVPLASALMADCPEKGEDMLTGMRYRRPGLYERGLTNAANALAAIETRVFSEHALTLTEVIRAMRENFQSEFRPIREALLSAPKWGTANPLAQRVALSLFSMRERVLRRIDEACGHDGHVVSHVVRSLHYFDGRRIAASPDGRLAGTPVADSVGAACGTARDGVTGVLASVCSIDAEDYYRGGYNLNITLTQAQADTETVAALIAGFFRQGGQELQINSLDSEVLRQAQRQPEQHGDLVVRVAGLSARFVDLGHVEQNELIRRAEEARA